MNWTEMVAIASMLLSIVVLFGSALARETVGELKRRINTLESHNETRAREVTALDERSKGQTETLKRIEAQMVPRQEWESRHEATDSLLNRILAKLDSK